MNPVSHRKGTFKYQGALPEWRAHTTPGPPPGTLQIGAWVGPKGTRRGVPVWIFRAVPVVPGGY